MARNSRFKIFEKRKGTDSEWYWSLYAPNNKIILQSEGYQSKWGAIRGTLSVRFNSIRRNKFQEFIGEDGEFRFRLTAMNNKIIGASEGYKRKDGRSNGIDSVQKNAPFASMQIVPLK